MCFFVIIQFCQIVNQCFGSCSWSHWSWQEAGAAESCQFVAVFIFQFFALTGCSKKKKKKSKTKEIKPPPKKQNNWLCFNHRWILDVKLWFRFGVFAWEFCTCRTEIQLYWLFFTMCTVIIAGNYDLDFSNFCKQPGLSHLLCVPSIPSTTNILP